MVNIPKQVRGDALLKAQAQGVEESEILASKARRKFIPEQTTAITSILR
jgi:hypothetical protein